MIAVVTGAGRGIGRAIAVALADRGCDVALLGRTRSALEGVSQAIAARAPSRRVLPVACDVARAEDVEAAARRVVGELGTPSVVVSNAGVVHRATIREMTEAEWDDVLDVNLKGTFLVTRAFLPSMLEQRRGRLIAIGSISGTLGTPRQAAYCASKWGTVGFVKSLAEELRGTGLQTMCVMPGSVDTDMLKGSGFPPMMQPEDVAKVVVFTALDAPDAMNGSSIDVFGP